MAEVSSHAKGQDRRPRVPGGRHKRVAVVFTDDEYELIQLKAVSAGVSVPRLLVDASLYSDRRSVAARRAQSAELQKALRDLRGIGTNVNQLTMTANASGHVIAGTADALAALARIEDRLVDAIEGFR